MLTGYAGKIGWVDLTEGTARIDDLDEGMARKYLGGKAMGAYLLLRHLPPKTPPYDPDNILIFITGPLSGTTFPAASRSAVITRSPMTGTFLDSYCGGFFGPHLKRAGLDYREFAVVLTHKTLDDCLASLGSPRVFALSTRGQTHYSAPAFRAGDAFLFGPETRGLPGEILEALPMQQCLRIPMRAGSRSLNLSNAAAILVYEAWRQHNFADGA